MGKMAMRKLASVVLITLLASSTVSMAQPVKTIHKPPHAAATTATQDLLPEAAAMRDAQKFWPGRPLCDDGGERIRPRDMGGEHRGRAPFPAERNGGPAHIGGRGPLPAPPPPFPAGGYATASAGSPP